MALAATTQTSNPVVLSRLGKTGPPFKRLFFGFELPKNVAYAEMWFDNLQQQQFVRWISMDGAKHEMPFEQTDECVLAVLTAMKLTC